MEQAITYVVNLLISLADKYEWLSITLMVIGGLYFLLSALRGFLTLVVKATKTDKDDKVISTIFAFLDKFAFGFGPLADYFESKVENKKEDEE